MRERSNRPGRKYAAIPNDAMRDKRLSAEARGLLALLMTYSDDWNFQRDHLMDMIGMGKDRFGKVMGELISCGYVEMAYNRDEKGHLLGKTWVIRDDATDVREMPTSDATDVRETRRPVKPTSGETAPLRIPTEEEYQKEEALGSGEPKIVREQLTLLSEEVAPTPKDDAFNRFWAIYPKKADKPAARKAFDRALKGGADPEIIISAARRYARWLNDARPGEFRPQVKYPQGWLTGERWNDPDLPPEAPPPRRVLGPGWGEVVR